MVSDPGPGGHPQGAGAGSVASCSIPVLQGGFMESVCLPAGKRWEVSAGEWGEFRPWSLLLTGCNLCSDFTQ